MMSIADAMVKAGIVTSEDTPNAKRKKRQEQEKRAYREKIDEALNGVGAVRASGEDNSRRGSPRFFVGEAIPSKAVETLEERDDSRVGPERLKGEMVWLHKTAPILVIKGRRGLSPDEMAAGRRR